MTTEKAQQVLDDALYERDLTPIEEALLTLIEDLRAQLNEQRVELEERAACSAASLGEWDKGEGGALFKKGVLNVSPLACCAAPWVVMAAVAAVWSLLR